MKSSEVDPSTRGDQNSEARKRKWGKVYLNVKLTGERLQAALNAQREAVTLVRADGKESRGISPRWAAGSIVGAAFTGFSKNGVVWKIRADDAARRGPFATRHAVAAVMADFPRLPHVEKNAQDPGAKQWAPQPVFAGTGQTGKVSTVHIG